METENNKLLLKERSTGLMAILTDQDKAREHERKLTIQSAIENGVPVNVLKQTVGGRAVSVALDIQLTRLVGNLNLKWTLNDTQIKTIVEDLLDKYPGESLDDFILCFKQARQGEFGELIRLDSPIIFTWMDKYLDAKYKVIEDNLAREKDEYYKTIIPTNSDRDWLGEWQKAVNQSQGVQNVPQLTPEEIEKEGQARPATADYQFNESEAQVKLRESRQLLAECQAQTIRERHPEWSEDQVQARVKELQAQAIQKEENPGFSPAVKKIMESKRRKQA